MPRTEAAFQQVREASRRRILDGALRVFADKGTEATMADVAREAGVSQGLAYRYFPSKEAILSVLVHETTDAGGGFYERVKLAQGTAKERLEFLLVQMTHAIRETPEYYQLFRHVLRDGSVPEELRAAVAKNGDAVRNTMRKLIVEAQSRGDIAGDDPDQLLAALLACIDGLASRMSGPGRVEYRKNFPDSKIILRMLKHDADRGRDSE